jgi:hypothetical protein
VRTKRAAPFIASFVQTSIVASLQRKRAAPVADAARFGGKNGRRIKRLNHHQVKSEAWRRVTAGSGDYLPAYHRLFFPSFGLFLPEWFGFEAWGSSGLRDALVGTNPHSVQTGELVFSAYLLVALVRECHSSRRWSLSLPELS